MTWLNFWYFITFIGWFFTTIAAYPDGFWSMVGSSAVFYTVWMLGYCVRDEQAKKLKRDNRFTIIK